MTSLGGQTSLATGTSTGTNITTSMQTGTVITSNTETGTGIVGNDAGASDVLSGQMEDATMETETGTEITEADPDWAEWPIPNCNTDVVNGAPNLEHYTDNGDGTVIDNVTGLLWQQDVSSTKAYTWNDAISYCSELILAGQEGWRLPSRIELVSIVDYDQSNPSIDVIHFTSTPAVWFWASTPAVEVQPSAAWGVSFDYGYTYSNSVTLLGDVRCVRSSWTAVSVPVEQYVVTSSNNTVYDTKTKLTWRQTVPVALYALADAKIYCSGLGTGWRLPTVKELESIVDDSQSNPSIDSTVFPSTPSNYFWSMTNAGSPVVPWLVDFSNGWTGSNIPNANNVRCVQ